MSELNFAQISEGELREIFPKQPDNAHKGVMGRVLVICGSYNEHGTAMCGAAYFAAMSAYRTGAGIVELFVPKENYAPLVSLVPEAVFSLYDREEPTEDVLARLEKQMLWAEKSLINIAGAGRFAADRSIKEYAENIWNLKEIK